ncbi:nucleotidyltransferase domain-containing protein [Thiocapsa sp.]|uniref:nucleotidyltransferase domain-containing protein n=1 Tax=Thiocapsa sp. TaxID=2024551 RepID=UPI002602E0E7|nr:nucleotidyltransferase domain-containing protein [Thiocapsa sp.]
MRKGTSQDLTRGSFFSFPGAMMVNVSSDALSEVVDRIIQAVHPEQILLYGSQAWGQPNEDSDIDLLVVLGTSSEPGYRRAREVYRSLRGIRLPIEVVVRTRDEMIRAGRVSTSLERQALDRGRLLYG